MCALCFPFYCNALQSEMCARFSFILLPSLSLAHLILFSFLAIIFLSFLSLSRYLHSFLSICFWKFAEKNVFVWERHRKFSANLISICVEMIKRHAHVSLFSVCLWLVRIVHCTRDKNRLIAGRYKRKIISFAAKSMLFIFFLLVCSLFIRLFFSSLVLLFVSFSLSNVPLSVFPLFYL